MNKKKIIFWAALTLLVIGLIVCFFTCKEVVILFATVVVADFVGEFICKKLSKKDGTESKENSVEE